MDSPSAVIAEPGAARDQEPVDEATLGGLRAAWWGLAADARATGRLTATMARLAGGAGDPHTAPDWDFLPQLPLLEGDDQLVAEATWVTWLPAAIDAGHAGRLTPEQVAVLDDLCLGWRALPATGWLGAPAAAAAGTR